MDICRKMERGLIALEGQGYIQKQSAVNEIESIEKTKICA